MNEELTLYDKCAIMLFAYLKDTPVRDRYYYILALEYWNKEPCAELFMMELEDSAEEEWRDLNITFDMDYDEGQKVELISVFSETDILNITLKNLGLYKYMR